jgi:hypothetical protein
MNLNNYKKFLETKLEISDDMLYRLRSIEDNRANHNILYLNDNEADIPNLDISFLDSDKEKDDMSTFMPLDRADRVDMNDEEAKWNNKFRISGKWGRVVRKVLNAAKELPSDRYNLYNDIKDSDIEDYVNKFKSSKKRFDDFRLVHGEDIRHFYYHRNYSLGESGTLGDSCMRYEEAQAYLNIYTNNPDKIKLLILMDTDSEGDDIVTVSGIEYRIKARALIWTLDDGRIFMDRIYTHDSSDVELFKEYAKDNGWLFKLKQTFDNSDNITDAKTGLYRKTLSCTLSHFRYNTFPYMDTLKFFNGYTGLLQSDHSNMRNYRKLDETEGNDDMVDDDVNGGRISRDDAIHCEYGDGYTDSDTACYLEDEEVYAFPSRVYYSKYEETYILKNRAVKSRYLNDYLRERNSVEIWNWNIQGIDYMPEDHDDVIEVIRARDKEEYSTRTELRLKDDPNIQKYGDDFYIKGIFNDIEVGDKVRINYHAEHEFDPVKEYKVLDYVDVGGNEPYIDLGVKDEEGEEILFPVDNLTKIEKDPNQLELELSYEKFSHKYLNRYI